MRKVKKYKCICPRCEKQHLAGPKNRNRSFIWTGSTEPKLFCDECLIDMRRKVGLGDGVGSKPGPTTREARGWTPDGWAAYQRSLERMGRINR